MMLGRRSKLISDFEKSDFPSLFHSGNISRSDHHHHDANQAKRMRLHCESSGGSVDFSKVTVVDDDDDDDDVDDQPHCATATQSTCDF